MSSKTEQPQEAAYLSDAWVPTEPGETLSGRIVSVERGWSDFRNGFYPILRVETSDGETRAFHAFRQVAYNIVLDKRPKTGEQVTITFRGARAKKLGETNNPPVGYSLQIEGRGAQDDIDMYAAMDTRGARSATPEPDIPAVPPTQQDFEF
jgi:hypothetical protein